MTFQIHALAKEPFEYLFHLTDAELAAQGARRVTADASPGYPCRVSLADAEPGEDLLLLNHRHIAGPTPYAASHAIYVRRCATQAHPAPGTVPASLSSRLLSIRAFDVNDMMQDADVIDGADLSTRLTAMLSDRAITRVDIHNAKQGCFAARATRSNTSV